MEAGAKAKINEWVCSIQHVARQMLSTVMLMAVLSSDHVLDRDRFASSFPGLTDYEAPFTARKGHLQTWPCRIHLFNDR